MKSLSFAEFGNPEAVLAYKDVPLPEVKAGEVRVRMILAPIHNHHLWYIRGKYGIKPDLPAISGDEALGVIEAVGPGVRGLHVGQKIVACKMWGAWAEYFTAKAGDVVPVPKNVPDEVAAQLLSMPLSTLMLLGMTGAKSGEWVLQNAANGAVGKLLAGIAASRHIHVVSLVRSTQVKNNMSNAGIENVVSTSDSDWKSQVLALTGGHRAVAGVDSVGGEASADMLSLLGDGGTLISFGAQSQQPVMADPGDLIFYNKKIRGFWATRAAKQLPPKAKMRIFFNVAKALLLGNLRPAQAGGLNMERLSKALALKNLAEMLKAGRVSLPVAGIYPLSDYQAALALSEKPGRTGKVLFRPSS